MKLREITAQIEVKALCADPDTEIGGVECDSRRVRPGDLFVAVPGFQADGHRFIPAAAEKGCAAVLCQTPPEIDVPYILTDDSRLALALASCAFYRHPSREMKVIGVTGTNGKTTTTILVKQLLEKCLGAKVGLVGSIQNMIGNAVFHTEYTTPESNDLQALFRAMADAGCGYCVMEVSSHSLALHRVAGTRFFAGLFTNLTQDHLDFHGTMEEYARAKSLLFAMCEHAAGNLDDGWFQIVMDKAPAPVYTFSACSDAADLTARDIRLTESEVRFCALEGSELVRTHLNAPGQFSVYNALAALACARMAGIPLRDAAGALPECSGAKGRVEPVPTDGDYSIYIDYAVTPDAVENVLRTLRPVASGRLVMLFGCGGDRDRTKRPIMGRISAELADYVIVTSDNPRTEDPMAIIEDILPGVQGVGTPYTVICDRREAIRHAIEDHRPGDLILLCGQGHEDYQIIGHQKIHMDEREIVAEILREREERK
ncbi:MAG: UDP-N-acetylmuramoyl-L-alanyl-D-glutamate--2,6-diaminopimelate ligase [Oscillospiraceae bacterium]|nr:UDP-N-acetylmuramoyl-L-alanyl-D-glutamate--2,6-diaminopimelate ligase [Oscillospiraceae bacterium]